MSYASEKRARKRTKELRHHLEMAQGQLAEVMQARRGLEAQLVKAEETIANLRDDAKERAAELSRANTLIEEQAETIGTFKEEVFQLHMQNAELRGYIARVLEDDTVREVGGAKQDPDAMPDHDRHELQTLLARDHQARRRPPRSVRGGPSAMQAPMIYGGDGSICVDVTGHAGWMREPPKPPKHWTRR